MARSVDAEVAGIIRRGRDTSNGLGAPEFMPPPLEEEAMPDGSGFFRFFTQASMSQIGWFH